MMVSYELDEVDGQTFMFVEHPNYGGIWVLQQTDKERHTVSSIAKQDNVDVLFTDDSQVHGEWASIDYVNRIEDFNPEQRRVE